MRKFAVLMVLGVLVGGTREAAAQGVTDRVFMNIGFGVESGSNDAADTKTYTLYDETATVSSSTHWTSGSFFGGGVDFRVFKGFTVGVGYHQETNTTESAITGSIPHPIFFNQPRAINTTEGGLYRRENATHLTFGYVLAINPKLDVLVTAGPSFFRLSEDIVSEVEIVERGGTYTEVLVVPTVTTQKRSVTGYNVGADVTYMLWQNDSVRLGAGGFVRYTGATTDVRLLANDVETKVGGIQFGFGGRVRF
jgi:opacity protein-like surface antigen